MPMITGPRPPPLENNSALAKEKPHNEINMDINIIRGKYRTPGTYPSQHLTSKYDTVLTNNAAASRQPNQNAALSIPS